MSRRVAIAACVAIALTPGARADDTSRGVMLPALMAEPPGSIHVDSAATVVDNGHITTTFTLRHAGTATTVLLGRRFGWMGEAEPYPDRQFPELHATLNGLEVSLDASFTAYADSTDISRDVQAAGLDPFVVAETPPLVDRPVGAGADAFAHLLSLHAVEMMDDNFVARWQAQRVFRFALGKEPVSTLSLTYRARPGFALMSSDDIGKRIQLGSYCVTRSSLATKLGRDMPRQAFMAKTYDIATGIGSMAPKVATLQSNLVRSVYCGPDRTPYFGGAAANPHHAHVSPNGLIRLLELKVE